MMRIPEHIGLSLIVEDTPEGVVIETASGKMIKLSPEEEKEAIKAGIRKRILLQSNRDIELTNTVFNSIGSAIGFAIGGAVAGIVIGLIIGKK